MKYTWTQQEIAATRLYWIDHDIAVRRRREAQLGAAYWIGLICMIVILWTYFAW